MTHSQQGAVLTVAGASKMFGSALALDRAHLELRPGQLHALLGGNGSGKSTMIKMLAGVYHFDSGRIALRGQEIPARAWSARHAFDGGLRFVHQDLGLFPAASVAENICLGQAWPKSGPQIRWRSLWRKAAATLDQLAPGVSPRVAVGSLSPAQQTMVAIARALVSLPSDEPAAVLLDEPTAALAAADVALVFGVLRALTGLGHAVLYVTHRLDEVVGVADAVTVFRDGLTVGTVDKADATEPLLLEMIVGRPLASVFPSAPAVEGDTVALEVSHLSAGGLEDVSFSADKGEIIGVASLAGSGGGELLRAIYGAIPRTGSVRLNGIETSCTTPAEAIREGMSFVPADRARDAVYPAMTVEENAVAAFMKSLWWRGFYPPNRSRQFATVMLDMHNVKRASLSVPITSLSGGNQQKVVIARCLAKKPRLLLLDEPTQGVDVATRADIWASVQALAKSGCIVLVHSSDYEELVNVTDRILIIQAGHAGRLVTSRELDRHALTEIVYRQPGIKGRIGVMEERVDDGQE